MPAPPLGNGPPTKHTKEAEEEDEEDDYMNMSFTNPSYTTSTTQTSLQRRQARERNASERGRTKSKAELERDAERAREEALDRPIFHGGTPNGDGGSNSKAAAMMKKMGYTPGSALGAMRKPSASPDRDEKRDRKEAATPSERLLEPLRPEPRLGREGIGLATVQSERVREAAALAAREQEAEQDRRSYRERQVEERAEKRAEGQWWGAMRILQTLHDDTDATADVEAGSSGRGKAEVKRPIRGYALLYRPLLYDRREKESEQRQRVNLTNSLSIRAQTSYGDDSDEEDAQGLACEVQDEDDNAENDEEVQAYLALPISERLEKVLRELRDEWSYCFWCKHRYSSMAELGEECPGEGEDDHG